MTMKKAVVFAAMSIVCLASLFMYYDQPKEQPAIVAVLSVNSERLKKLDGIRDGLWQYGFRDGENIKYVVFNAAELTGSLRSVAAEIVTMRPTVIVAMGGVEADILKELTRESKTPVVFAGVAAPIARNLVTTYNQPGNLTGIDNLQSELGGKRLELFTLLLPKAKRFLVVYDKQVPSGELSLEQIADTAQKLQLELEIASVTDWKQVDDILRQAHNKRFDAIVLLPSYMWETSVPSAEIALTHGIPVLGLYEFEADRGFLASYGPSYYNQGIQAARLVAKVLQGQYPSQIPVERAYRLDFTINLRIAKKLGIDLNREALKIADKVIAGGVDQ